ncbi:hypothetical protein AVEN_158884-1 [Araneus ventricosus]|uniref:Uncharacterized protein n=1 Tax=Araneus ventricosus TaxID=182803 RepID=A0A4Y2BAF2_ARAVE|nr:hypothetical protein AVEN_158884-1 [Araneus ventricosus]
MTRTAPEMTPPSQASPPHHWEDVLTPKGRFDKQQAELHTRRNFGRIRFRTWNPPSSGPDLTTRPWRPRKRTKGSDPRSDNPRATRVVRDLWLV